MKLLHEHLQYKNLYSNLVTRDLKVRYKRSLLGVSWAFFEPIIQMVIYSIVFSYFLKVPVENYPVFVLTGLVAWSYFSSGLVIPQAMIRDNAPLIKKIYFPREILPLASLMGRAVHFWVSLLVLIPFLIYFDVSLNPELLYLPLLFLVQTLLMAGIVLMLAPLNTLYDDIGFLTDFSLRALFYLSPVVYPASMVPDEFRGVFDLNPMSILIEAYRDIILYGRQPDLFQLLALTAVTLVLVVTGLWIFRRMQTKFAEVL